MFVSVSSYTALSRVLTTKYLSKYQVCRYLIPDPKSKDIYICKYVRIYVHKYKTLQNWKRDKFNFGKKLTSWSSWRKLLMLKTQATTLFQKQPTICHIFQDHSVICAGSTSKFTVRFIFYHYGQAPRSTRTVKWLSPAFEPRGKKATKARTRVNTEK